ncbi:MULTISPECIES: YqaH family protein [Bacillus amyloliquefaciens group]|uniref:YqaH family protein n=1 Tax=Bacillus amyloliquefaciens group TaxID=1938374 RepID=UPI0005A52232|nr:MULTISPECIES: YqaH family protein [Bacillus amyloliquefaciens group]MED0751654.1 YqaH family protein [Bacillus amyloliquefaciens]UZD73471.1 hypothetical protein OM992_17150 [Bacillus siamensis]
MNLNHFLKSDREKAERLLRSTQNFISELLPSAIEDQDFDGCVEIAASIISNCKDLKRMEHPEQMVKIHEIVSGLKRKGIGASTVRRSYQ